MRFTKDASQKLLPLILLMTVVLMPAAHSQQASIVPGHFHFRQFQVPNQFVLGVENINNFGTVVGYYQVGTATSPGPLRGFELTPWGKLLTLIDPLDIEQPSDPFGGVTEALGVNDLGVVVGEYWDVKAGHYAGFFLINGKYVTYNVPGYFNTVVQGINDNLSDFAGFVQTGAPDFITSAYVSNHGKVTVFTVPGASLTEATAINNFGQVTGFYLDASGLYHGFIRDAKGRLTYPLDVPGVTTSQFLGTIALGINDLGIVSGHFWDAANVEHGFVRTRKGRFYQIDVPGAAATAGGGLNDFGVVVGHWNDQNGNQNGYIAIPDFNPND